MTAAENSHFFIEELYTAAISVAACLEMAELESDRAIKGRYIAAAKGAIVTMRENLGESYRIAESLAAGLNEVIGITQRKLM